MYVPGLTTLPAVDRDEARFAQASRQMFESVALPPEARNPDHHSGGLVVPMIQDRPRLNKPPLIYWFQAASAALLTGGNPLRDAVWMYRIPSTLAAIASVLMLWRMGRSMFDPRAAFLGAAMLALCPLFVWEARQARADHLLTACTTAAMWALWSLWNSRRPRRSTPAAQPEPTRASRRARSHASLPWIMLLWVALALGVLTKGPIAPMVVLLAALCLSLLTRRWRWLLATSPVLGVAILALALVPWLVPLTERYGLANYLALVYDETLGRASSPRESHHGPPGYHIILLILMLWPASMVTGMSVARAWTRTIRGLRPWKWRAAAPTRSRSAELFCLAWVLPSWLVFELAATKLPHYPMPLFPALALLSARTLLAASAGSVPAAFGRLASAVYVIWIGLSALLSVGLLAASLLLFDAAWSGPVSLVLPLAILMLLIQVVLLVRAIASLARRKPARAMRAALAMAAILWISVLGVILPRVPSLWPTRALGRTLHTIDPTDSRPLATLYREDSVIFETRGRARRMHAPDELRAFLLQHPDALAIIRQDDLSRFPDLRPLAYLRGFNVARFARERLAIVQPLPMPPPSTPQPGLDAPHDLPPVSPGPPEP